MLLAGAVTRGSFLEQAAMAEIKISSLHIYPVKSLRGITLEESTANKEGLQHDRRWMVVRENGIFMTQRDNGRMALIETALAEGGVRLSRKGFGSISVPFDAPTGEPIESRVWGDHVIGLDLGDDLAHWLTDALEEKSGLRLVCMQPGFRRAGLETHDKQDAHTVVCGCRALPGGQPGFPWMS